MRIKKVAVLGAGTMGAQIAAHLANASIPSLLFDLPGLAKQGVAKLTKLDPAPLFDPDLASLTEPLEFESDFKRLKEADWILEAVVEDLDIKRKLLQLILPQIRADAFITSNTSGLPLSQIAAEMPEDFKKRWFGTHFFNPPRYLKLLELIPTEETDATLLKDFSDFAERILGKGIVYAKDTPNFIANRLATFSGLYTLKTVLEEGYTVEEVDALTGPIIGRPKTATFRLFDLIGIDVICFVAQNLYENAKDDEQREIFKTPELLCDMLSRKWLGAKTGQGFYKKEGNEILALDFKTMEYRPQKKASFASVEMARPLEDPAERLANLLRAKDRAGAFLWKTLSALLVYTAHRIPEISDDILNIDRSMKWGFGWSHGLFEIWDAIGVPGSVEQMRTDGHGLPSWTDALLAEKKASFYKAADGETMYWDVLSSSYKPVPHRTGVLGLNQWKKTHGVVKKNAGASLVDLGDGVACLEFHSKMNAIGSDTLQMVKTSLEIVEKDFQAMIIANQGENFSVGANLMLLLMEAQEGNWEDLDLVVRAFQNMAMSLRYSPKPVLAAPFALALGGGCEVCMGADAVHSAAEVYTGLVEVGVGLIPAGGGSKEILRRQLQRMPPGADPLPYVRKAFETVALGKVSRSVLDAKRIGYFSESDTFSMNGDHLIRDAKSVALQMAVTYRQSQPRHDILLTGRAGFAYLQVGIFLMKEAGYISEFDQKIGEKIAWIMTGGDLSRPTEVNEQFVLDLEREAFLSLLGERKTQERIQHMLKTGKPLRN